MKILDYLLPLGVIAGLCLIGYALSPSEPPSWRTGFVWRPDGSLLLADPAKAVAFATARGAEAAGIATFGGDDDYLNGLELALAIPFRFKAVRVEFKAVRVESIPPALRLAFAYLNGAVAGGALKPEDAARLATLLADYAVRQGAAAGSLPLWSPGQVGAP